MVAKKETVCFLFLENYPNLLREFFRLRVNAAKAYKRYIVDRLKN